VIAMVAQRRRPEEIPMTNQRRPGAWLPSVYYYVATAIGLIVMLFGLVGGLRGLVTAALPEISSDVRYATVAPAPGKPDGTSLTPQEQQQAHDDAVHRARIGGYADALYGAVSVVVGAPVFWWHLRQARRREPDLLAPVPPPTAP
jgi:hypothetical protein